MIRSWLPYVLLPAIIYAAIVFLLWLLQERLVFLPMSTHVAQPDARGLNYENVTIDTDDDELIHGWYLPASATAPVVLFLHGNAGNISHRIDTLTLLNELGASVLIIDYRGYGKSSGRPSEQGTYLDANASWRYLVEVRGIEPERIILFGRSLGGGIAGWLAAEQNPAMLVLESTFTSIPDLAVAQYRWLPARRLTRIHFNTAARLPDIKTPVVVLHSPDDEIIGIEHGRRLYAQAANPFEFVELTGGHNDGFVLSGDVYIEAWQRILGYVTRGSGK